MDTSPRRRQVLVLETRGRDIESPVIGSGVCGSLHLPSHDAYRSPAQAVRHGWRLLAPPKEVHKEGHWEYEWWFEREEPEA